MRLLATHHGAVLDGRYLMYLEGGTAPSYEDAVPVILSARTLQVVRRLSLPAGCQAVFFASGKTLLHCSSPNGWGVMDVWSGVVRTFAPGTAPRYLDGFGPHDFFGGFGRYWAFGRRMDRHYREGSDAGVYLNLHDGHIRLARHLRDLDDPNLGPYDPGPCGSARRGRYDLGFERPLPNGMAYREVVLYDCRRHTHKTIARCPRGCDTANAPVAERVAVWVSHHGRRLHARRVDGRRTCTWRLPASEGVLASVGGGRVFASMFPSYGEFGQLRVAGLARC